LLPIPFWFLRHGETDWNAAGLSQGQTEVPLNARGLAQAASAGLALRGQGIVRVVASPLGRARQTAAIVAGSLGLGFSLDDGLKETCFGAEEGRPMGDWYHDWVEGAYTPEGAESFADLQARVVPAVNRVLAGPGLALIVAHGAMFRAIRAAMGLSALVRTENGAVVRCSPGEPWVLG